MQQVHFKVPSFSHFLMGAVCRYRNNTSVLHTMYINNTFFRIYRFQATLQTCQKLVFDFVELTLSKPKIFL